MPWFYPWMLRLELDRKKMLTHKLEMKDVKAKIEETFKEAVLNSEIAGDRILLVKCINSDDNAETLVIRIHLVDVRFRFFFFSPPCDCL